ncbi:hypothetical protein QJQ45_027494 [Haematococcus lacustris]|nr:hypothetical protein QJQ45_027494 [Haematococcus lacustris]
MPHSSTKPTSYRVRLVLLSLLLACLAIGDIDAALCNLVARGPYEKHARKIQRSAVGLHVACKLSESVLHQQMGVRWLSPSLKASLLKHALMLVVYQEPLDAFVPMLAMSVTAYQLVSLASPTFGRAQPAGLPASGVQPASLPAPLAFGLFSTELGEFHCLVLLTALAVQRLYNWLLGGPQELAHLPVPQPLPLRKATPQPPAPAAPSSTMHHGLRQGASPSPPPPVQPSLPGLSIAYRWRLCSMKLLHALYFLAIPAVGLLPQVMVGCACAVLMVHMALVGWGGRYYVRHVRAINAFSLVVCGACQAVLVLYHRWAAQAAGPGDAAGAVAVLQRLMFHSLLVLQLSLSAHGEPGGRPSPRPSTHSAPQCPTRTSPTPYAPSVPCQPPLPLPSAPGCLRTSSSDNRSPTGHLGGGASTLLLQTVDTSQLPAVGTQGLAASPSRGLRSRQFQAESLHDPPSGYLLPAEPCHQGLSSQSPLQGLTAEQGQGGAVSEPLQAVGRPRPGSQAVHRLPASLSLDAEHSCARRAAGQGSPCPSHTSTHRTHSWELRCMISAAGKHSAGQPDTQRGRGWDGPGSATGTQPVVLWGDCRSLEATSPLPSSAAFLLTPDHSTDSASPSATRERLLTSNHNAPPHSPSSSDDDFLMRGQLGFNHPSGPPCLPPLPLAAPPPPSLFTAQQAQLILRDQLLLGIEVPLISHLVSWPLLHALGSSMTPMQIAACLAPASLYWVGCLLHAVLYWKRPATAFRLRTWAWGLRLDFTVPLLHISLALLRVGPSQHLSPLRGLMVITAKWGLLDFGDQLFVTTLPIKVLLFYLLAIWRAARAGEAPMPVTDLFLFAAWPAIAYVLMRVLVQLAASLTTRWRLRSAVASMQADRLVAAASLAGQVLMGLVLALQYTQAAAHASNALWRAFVARVDQLGIELLLFGQEGGATQGGLIPVGHSEGPSNLGSTAATILLTVMVFVVVSAAQSVWGRVTVLVDPQQQWYAQHQGVCATFLEQVLAHEEVPSVPGICRALAMSTQQVFNDEFLVQLVVLKEQGSLQQALATLHIIHWGWKAEVVRCALNVRTLPLVTLPSVIYAKENQVVVFSQDYEVSGLKFEDWTAQHQTHGVRSFMVVPLLFMGQDLGALILMGKSSGSLGSGLQRLVVEVRGAALTALMLTRALLNKHTLSHSPKLAGLTVLHAAGQPCEPGDAQSGLESGAGGRAEGAAELPPVWPVAQLQWRHLLSPMRCMFSAALQSLSTHLPGCGAGLALAALPLPLPLVGSAAGSLRLAGWGVLGPGSEAAGCVAAWLLHGACGALRGANTGLHIRPWTGWSRCWLQAGRSRRGSTCPAGGFQSAGLVALRLLSQLSQGCLPFTAELTRLVLCSSTSTTLPRRWSVPLGLHTTLQQARSTASAPHPPRKVKDDAWRHRYLCCCIHWLLQDIMPQHVADSLTRRAKVNDKDTPNTQPSPERSLLDAGPLSPMQTHIPYKQWHPAVSVLFADIVGFTNMSQQCEPEDVMRMLHDLFSRYDALCGLHGVYKVETIGDAVSGGRKPCWPGVQFMACTGLLVETEAHAHNLVEFGKAMLDAAAAVPSLLGGSVQIRVGIHSGRVMSGVVGITRARYALFGDTVNTASRMESTGLPGRLQVSEATYSLLPPERRALEWEQRGSIEVKGKGKMSTYLLRVDHGQPRKERALSLDTAAAADDGGHMMPRDAEAALLSWRGSTPAPSTTLPASRICEHRRKRQAHDTMTLQVRVTAIIVIITTVIVTIIIVIITIITTASSAVAHSSRHRAWCFGPNVCLIGLVEAETQPMKHGWLYNVNVSLRVVVGLTVVCCMSTRQQA